MQLESQGRYPRSGGGGIRAATKARRVLARGWGPSPHLRMMTLVRPPYHPFSARRRGAMQVVDSQSRDRGKSAGELQEKLRAYGVAGVVSYGLFNTLYYSGMFVFVWVVVAKVPRGIGAAAASRRLAEVLAITWAGSQVTKVLRAGLALGLAPVVDRSLQWLTQRFQLRSKGQAVTYIVVACLLSAAALFAGIVAVWA